MSYIKKVIPKEEFLLEVQLDNGSSMTLNLEDRLLRVRFGALADKEFFKKATTDNLQGCGLGCVVRQNNWISCCKL